MATSPCNNLNVKTLRISQLAATAGINSSDLISISQYDSNNDVYYSKKATFGNLVNYLSTVSGSYSGSIKLTSGITGSIVTANAAGSFGNDKFFPVLINNVKYKIPLYPNT